MAEDKHVRLSAFLKDKYINLDLKGKRKSEIISELVSLAAKSGRIKNIKSFQKALAEREKLGSTAIGNGIAIPHVKVKGVNKATLAFGRVNQGVDFNALDGEKTYIFFLLVSTPKDIGLHLKLLAKISHLLIRDKFTVELLKRAKNKAEVLRVIKDSENTAIAG